MIKCSNCNQENADGSRFCCGCGKKLEVTVTCPGCNAQVAFGAAFCPQCGTGLKGQSSSGVNMSGAVVAGDVQVDASKHIGTLDKSTHIGAVDASTTQNIVEGDVNIDNSTNNYNASTIQIINQHMTKSTVTCHKCGKSVEKSVSVKCPQCGDYFCAEHINKGYGLCVNCAAEAKRLLKIRSYREAAAVLDKALAEGATDADVYYYRSLCLLDGKKANIQQRATIDAIVKNLNTAISINPKGIYYYVLAYIKYDYFERKYLNVKPDYRATLQMALYKRVTPAEINEFYYITGVDCPAALRF